MFIAFVLGIGILIGAGFVLALQWVMKRKDKQQSDSEGNQGSSTRPETQEEYLRRFNRELESEMRTQVYEKRLRREPLSEYEQFLMDHNFCMTQGG